MIVKTLENKLGGGEVAVEHQQTKLDDVFGTLASKTAGRSAVNYLHAALGLTTAATAAVTAAEVHLDAARLSEIAQANIRVALADEKYHSNQDQDVVIATSDWHNNFEIAATVAEICKTTDSNTLLDCGDLTYLGWPLEFPFMAKIIRTFEDQGIDYVLAAGNHDSGETIRVPLPTVSPGHEIVLPGTEALARALGATVLKNADLVDINGHYYAGVSDPQYIMTPVKGRKQLGTNTDQLEAALENYAERGIENVIVVKHRKLNPSSDPDSPQGFQFLKHPDNIKVTQVSGHKHRLEPTVAANSADDTVFELNNTNGQWRHPSEGMGIGWPSRTVIVTALIVDKNPQPDDSAVERYFQVRIQPDGAVEASDIITLDHN